MNNSPRILKKVFADGKEMRQRSESILSSKNNRLTLMLAIFIIIGAAVALVYAEYCVIMAIGADEYAGWFANAIVALVMYVADFAAAVYLIGPLTVGVYLTAVRMCRGQYCNLADIFECFASAVKYDRAVGISCRVLLKYGGFLLGALLVQNFYVRILLALGGCILCLLCVGHSGVCRELFFTDKAKSDCRSAVYDRMHGHKGEMCKIRLSYVPWVLLGILSLGVLLIIDTIPYILVSNAEFAERLANHENNEGSVQNEQQT